jgi:aminoglycoside 6-adenylyltransferase
MTEPRDAAWCAYDSLLDRLVRWGQREESIRGLILLGSRARITTPADEWSDIDLLVVTTDRDRWLGDGAWLSELGDVVVTFVEPTALAGLLERRVLFKSGMDLDLVMVSADRDLEIATAPDALAVLAAGHQVLLEKDGRFGILHDRIAAVHPPSLSSGVQWPAEAGEVANLIGDYWYHCVWTTKKLRRGEQMTALVCLNGYLRRVMLRFVEWEAKARSGGEAETWFDGRFLERWAAPDTALALRQTVARYDQTDIARALFDAMALFSRLSRDMARTVSLPYPDATEHWVRAWVQARLEEVGLTTDHQ